MFTVHYKNSEIEWIYIMYTGYCIKINQAPKRHVFKSLVGTVLVKNNPHVPNVTHLNVQCDSIV